MNVIERPFLACVAAGLLCGALYVLVKLVLDGAVEKLSAGALAGQVVGGASAGLLLGVLSGSACSLACRIAARKSGR